VRLLPLFGALALAGCLAAPAAPFAGQVVTFADLAQGALPGGRDKQGTGGITVLVHNVTVRKVLDEDDGDWHLNSSDATWQPFVLEIIPRDQGDVGKPPTGLRLAVLGVPFCDRQHAGEAWHGNTCWELHPVVGWQPEP